MKLTPHEQKVFDLVQNFPEILNNPTERKKIAEENNLSEKTLRNRIAELKKRGLIDLSPEIQPAKNKSMITENDEINLSAIWEMVKLKRKFIFKFASFCTIIGLSYSLFATLYFKSTTSLYPAGELNQSGGMLGDFQGLAKTFGMGSLGSAPTYNIPDIIKSRRLKKDIVLKNWKTQKFPQGSNLIKFWELGKPKLFSPRQWLSKLLPKGEFKTDKNLKLTHDAILELDGLISVKEELSGLITVSVLIQDPNLAADIANHITHYVKDFISFEQHQEASRNRTFIEDQKSEAKHQLELSEETLTSFQKKHQMARDTPEIKMQRDRLTSSIEENRAVYITLRQQFEIAKIDEKKEKLLINVLDIAEPAIKKDKPKRTLIVLLSLFGGLMLAIPIALFRNTH
ncbi:MAG: hypothetical protein HOB40_10430 [Candidatus Marinimicrobia bacterium]|jgi:uncharacterized protein involved in exopolysaccharide biosynthesis|nr:hypothetical protein [Candidatus Neomarinimicrobiota bacterium]MBT3496831.1 hypothetical protein [Candidatus Neomarinimicrobiota bacterium]MBT3693020.1 hypothetical protein [Candidatus Neomarinimicrobiota bacterium]MBT4145184.1 hypothetical protein [Candidatus Neomarinimicrobiota bacterium]MBT4990780.1 hypothetical protein [Candidatus Neomarinimicrobiota bacterium]